jgi:Holliday junction resolvase
MPSKAKTKGSSWEREICSKLSNIFGGSFVRSNNSGAFTGGTNAYRRKTLSGTQIMNSKGDIVPPDHLKHLVIEAKFYKEFIFHQLLTDECKQLDTWIKQTLDAVDSGDVWFTIFKINRKGSYVCFESKLVKQHNLILGSHSVYRDYIVCDFETFFTVNKSTILSICA